MEALPTSPPRPASEPKVYLVWVWPSETMIMMDSLISTCWATTVAFYRNNGDGTFTDVTARAGVGNEGKWGSSAAWFDYDNDGKLDLVVANYVNWSPQHNVWCGDHRPGYRGYCHPDVYEGEPPTLYRNNGDGTFTDVSKSSGVGLKPGNGLGVVTFDYDQDGW